MYNPTFFQETDESVLREFIAKHPFATLISGSGADPKISHIPMYLVEEGGKRYLLGHLAKANDHCRFLDGTCTAIFHGPHAYVSSKWYAARNVVPTWNYVVVHVSGTLSKCSSAELSSILALMIKAHEGDVAEFNRSLDDKVRAALEEHIVGVKVDIKAMDGKWKLSQNKSSQDQERIASRLAESGDWGARQIARLMTRRILKN